jgi:hypothetical protein
MNFGKSFLGPGCTLCEVNKVYSNSIYNFDVFVPAVARGGGGRKRGKKQDVDEALKGLAIVSRRAKALP